MYDKLQVFTLFASLALLPGCPQVILEADTDGSGSETGEGEGDGDGDEAGDGDGDPGDGDGDGEAGDGDGDGAGDGDGDPGDGDGDGEAGDGDGDGDEGLCGNGVIEGSEWCDGDQFDDQTTCENLGYAGGTLACTEECTLDTSACHNCGNGAVDPGEECDDGNKVDADACLNSCLNAICGDGVVWAAGQEACDCGEDGVCTPDELGGQTCVDEGFGGGDLGCFLAPHVNECQLDTSDCVQPG